MGYWEDMAEKNNWQTIKWIPNSSTLPLNYSMVNVLKGDLGIVSVAFFHQR